MDVSQFQKDYRAYYSKQLLVKHYIHVSEMVSTQVGDLEAAARSPRKLWSHGAFLIWTKYHPWFGFSWMFWILFYTIFNGFHFQTIGDKPPGMEKGQTVKPEKMW